MGRSECEAQGGAGRLIEIPARHCKPAEAFGVAAETRVFLGEPGISLTAEQQTKTRRALEFIANERAQPGDRVATPA